MKSIHSKQDIKFREMLTDARKAAGLSQADMAKKIDLDQSTVSKIERGERRIDVIEFLNWCRAADIDPVKVIRELF